MRRVLQSHQRNRRRAMCGAAWYCLVWHDVRTALACRIRSESRFLCSVALAAPCEHEPWAQAQHGTGCCIKATTHLVTRLRRSCARAFAPGLAASSAAVSVVTAAAVPSTLRSMCRRYAATTATYCAHSRCTGCATLQVTAIGDRRLLQGRRLACAIVS